MERISFAYTGKTDLLSPKTRDFMDFLLHLRASKTIEIKARYSSSVDSPVHSRLALRIQLEGELPDIEGALDEIIKREGEPQIMDEPPPGVVGRVFGFLYSAVRNSSYSSSPNGYKSLMSRIEAKPA